jgi:hypothetical protein
MATELLGTVAFLSSGAETLFLSPVVSQRVAEAVNYILSRILQHGIPVMLCTCG